MKTNVKKNTINFKGKMGSIGVDMHKRSWHITVLADGQVSTLCVFRKIFKFHCPDHCLT